MIFSNNLMPFNALPTESHAFIRNVLSSLFLDVLENGDHTFTARLCHLDQTFTEPVCVEPYNYK
jgi:hypothetical protein